MYFSEAFNISDSAQYDWFDAILDTDTPLFIDPFLLFKEDSGLWADAHQELAQHFQSAFELLAGHHERTESLQYKKTLRLMTFPEPEEFCLGMASSNTSGSGTGRGFAKLILRAMSEAIERGLQDMRHFEELGVLVPKIGRDRISDITCNLLMPRFIRYTQEVATRLAIPIEPLEVRHSVYDPYRMEWKSGTFVLPKNPISGRAVLLTPKRFLRELPSLDVEDWWNYVEPFLRDDLNLAIGQKLKKTEIISIARTHTGLVREWAEAREHAEAHPYPVDRDPEGLHQWQAQTRHLAFQMPLDPSPVSNVDDLNVFVQGIIAKFKLFVEEKGGWELLYNDDTKKPKRERSIQLLFKGVVQSYCEAAQVQLEREVELGRGPVDFALSVSYKVRLLLEIKKMSNTNFWEGLESQLISYMRSDECENGWFLAVRFGDSKPQQDRTARLQARTDVARRTTKFNVHSEWVDARPKRSASELKIGELGTRIGEVDDEFSDGGRL
jgi:hypothetical protein